MKRELKEGDVMYLEQLKVEIKAKSESSYKIGFINVAYDALYVPKSIEKLLSFTPYHFEGDYLVGFTQVRPWQPKEDDVVWGWDEGDQQKYIGLYVGYVDGFHELKTTKPTKDGKKPIIEGFKFVEPFEQ